MAVKPPYAPNVVNQTVDYGGAQWKGQPGGDWVLQGTSGGSSGSSSGDISSLMGQWDTQRKATEDAAAARENDFLTRFRGAISGQEGVSAMASRIGNELGLPGLQSNVTNLSTLLQNMPYTQKAATAGTDVNQNQLDRIIASKASALAPTVTGVTNAYNAATQNLGTQLGYGVQQQQKELLPYSTEASMLSDRAAREVSGYTTQMQSELDALISKMQTDAQLKESELSRMQQLATAEQQHEDITRYLSGTNFYDTQSGQWIQAPKQTAGTGSSVLSYLTPTTTSSTAAKPPSYFLPFTL